MQAITLEARDSSADSASLIMHISTSRHEPREAASRQRACQGRRHRDFADRVMMELRDPNYKLSASGKKPCRAYLTAHD